VVAAILISQKPRVSSGTLARACCVSAGMAAGDFEGLTMRFVGFMALILASGLSQKSIRGNSPRLDLAWP
jgi:hypothetical protein